MNNLTLEEVQRIVESLPIDEAKKLLETPGIVERLGTSTKLNEKQVIAKTLLNSASTHCMLFGGSRSGKTFIIMDDIIERCIAVPSRHAVLRLHFNHVVNSIVRDTLPKLMDLRYPGIKSQCQLDKSAWIYRFPNGSEIWFGGLDEKERTEKILGQEYVSMFLNECSQIRYPTRQIAVTRLAQKTELRNKMYYDCNPASKRHWSYILFIDKIDPDRHQPLSNPDNYVSLQMNPEDNRENLTKEYMDELDSLDERSRKRFLLGIFSDDDELNLFTEEMLHRGRILDGKLPDMSRVVVAVDPSGCSGPEDLRSDEIGIVVCGVGVDGRAYILEDLSGRYGPDMWKNIAVSAYERHNASAIVAEINYGGAMVREVIRTAASDEGLPIPFTEVHASRGKVVRAEPISAMFEQGKASIVGRFKEMEDQLLAMTTDGYRGDRSPDRADAMVWGLTALFPSVVSKSRGRGKPIKINRAYERSKKMYGGSRSRRIR